MANMEKALCVTAMMALVLLLFVVANCSSAEECVDVSTECAPLYEPTFENIYTRTIVASCAVEGQCHGADKAQAGLDFSTEDLAYSALVSKVKIIAGDPACSPMVIRLKSSDSTFQMPPGAPLLESEVCAIVKWIKEGARP